MAISKTSTSDAVEFKRAEAASDVMMGEAGAGAASDPGAAAKPAPKSKAQVVRGKTMPKGAPTSETSVTKVKKTRPTETKAEMVLKKLRLTKGATLHQLIDATGWQAHSVRGFLSGTVKKKLGLNLISETSKDGLRRYRINDAAAVV
ncbi:MULTISPECIES: DUF3489 domain-containing protein [Aminobacter]|uniref:DUF3489 domain-containing protein n=1 Tax=Aminobacter ciceronei TaxID=150723 RepID=A0ABR6CGB2_9HYPH|nr:MULTISPECIES: DUF3489 domain-containing protein [Aminobacter]MBA8910296.1 hypothetical protein [Aminobacter ciceronei]MBA9024050.1 hypothetical protein [Aminobacter ciceronei]